MGGTDILIDEYVDRDQTERDALLAAEAPRGYDVEVQNRTPCHRMGSALWLSR